MKTTRRRWLMGHAAAPILALTLLAGAAQAQSGEPARSFEISSQPLAEALMQFSRQADLDVVASADLTRGKTVAGLRGAMTPSEALGKLLAGTGLRSTPGAGGGLILMKADESPQGASAGGGAETNVVEELVVTAQKKEEAIQTVPIAISAFTQKNLEEQHIEGGFDLLKAIPNVTFSKNNFTSYNFSIRGIGTKAVSATTDPGVAVSFNNIALIQNRLFEQEYFDVERVEVLRGPQGTLYGRNATAGVINVISAKPDMSQFKGSIKGEVGNYHTKRVSAMINIPIIEDKLAVRFAGSLTNRQGYDYNSITKHAINGRDLWSGRLTIAFNPTQKIHSNLVWERFNEDDDRSRTGKQLCHRDDGPDMVGDQSTRQHSSPRADGLDYGDVLVPALFSQGCKPGSLYDESAFGTPNGLALPFVFGMLATGTDYGGAGGARSSLQPAWESADGRPVTLLDLKDPYRDLTQSRDLRTIASFRDPKYRAKADVVEFNLEIELPHGLTLNSQTAYDKDVVYSFQDFNRFNTVPVFNDTSAWVAPFSGGAPSPYRSLAPGGTFCDPQLGCSNTMAGFDISTAKSKQFTQELRLQSDSDGPLNFSLGANYTRFKVLVDYYVFSNLVTAFALLPVFNTQSDITLCGEPGNPQSFGLLLPIDDPNAGCPYIDPNPIESINGDGHNYFRSKNPYKLASAGVFGELYWQVNEALKITAGLRYTDDKKAFTPVPSQVLLSKFPLSGGSINRGYPEKPNIKQHWGEFTGRLGVDWTPQISFTDHSMIYAFYSRGYKGGGANPPTPGFATIEETAANWVLLPYPILESPISYPATFRPEFVNAFEVGSKNTLLGGSLVLNGDAFYYDYKDYQVSKIVERSAVNENFDAKTWGLEFEALFSPSRNLRLNANLGYLGSKLGKSARSIDIMDRTAGNPNYIVVKPWAQLPSNCVVPVGVAEQFLRDGGGSAASWYAMCGGYIYAPNHPVDPATGLEYDPANYPDLSGGAGVYKNLAGNELPNSPHWTANIGAQYGIDFLDSWRITVRGDAYWQSQSWARVYNSDPYDKLHGWYNMNLSLWIEKPESGLKIEIYAKNVLDKTPITDAFLNSDDSALTTNVFILDPRIIGVSLTKTF